MTDSTALNRTLSLLFLPSFIGMKTFQTVSTLSFHVIREIVFISNKHVYFLNWKGMT